jgi:hypothetical protein
MKNTRPKLAFDNADKKVKPPPSAQDFLFQRLDNLSYMQKKARKKAIQASYEKAERKADRALKAERAFHEPKDAEF